MDLGKSEEIKLLSKEKIFTVSEFLDFLNNFLTFREAIIQGEIGSKINSYPKYTFFNLLDKNGSILKCFTWNEAIEKLGIIFKEGMEIKVIGYPEIRKDKGELMFQVKRIELVGEGALKEQFEALKRKLFQEGYFDEKFKKPIPRFCEKIGLITSKFGKGAKQDFEKHLGKFGFQVFFYDVRVEGSMALNQIIEAIDYFNLNFPYLDILVLIRGGGDWESLKPFNSEEIVKAIRASKIPVLCGIGHDSDETLADFAADFSASTPTHAAKVISENWEIASIEINKFKENFNFLINKIFKNIKDNIIPFKENLTKRLEKEINSNHEKINNLMRILNLNFKDYFRRFESLESEFKNNFLNIKRLIKENKLKIKQSLEELIKGQNNWKREIEKILAQQKMKLDISNPNLKLKQGYSITKDEFGKIIKEPKNLKFDQKIITKFYKGQIISKVKKINN